MKKVLITGHFNILHLGHIRLLNFAKSLGDYLIVGVESNIIASDHITNDEKVRLEAIKNLSVVDEVFIFDNLEKLFLKKKPNIIVKGKEYEEKKNQELKIIKKINAKIVYSSANFIDVEDSKKEEKINLIKESNFLSRNNIKLKSLQKIITNFRNLNVCVIGDFILDEYIKCSPIGMSQEDYTLTYRKENNDKFIGGSAIVAAHVVNFGAKVDYFTVLGNNDDANKVLEELNIKNLNKFIFIDKSRPTTVKQRFRTSNRNILKLSTLNESSINIDLQKKIFNKIKSSNTKYDLVIFSDFNYGVLNRKFVSKLSSYFKKNNVFIAADSQYSSQTGDMSKFKYCSLLTPTEYEVRSLLKDNDSGLIVLLDKLKNKLNCENTILKLGSEGVLLHSKSKNKWIDDRLSAMNRTPKDVNGAGDTMLAMSSLALTSKSTIWEAVYLSSIAAGLQVGKIGNAEIKIKEILKHL